MTEAPKLLDRSEEEIAQVVDEWIAGPNDDLESLQELLLGDQGWWCDEDATVEESRDPLGDAIAIIEDAIYRMEPTPLNLRRVQNWCRSYTLAAGYEALVGKFAELLTDSELRFYQQEVRLLFIPEVAEEWIGGAYKRVVSD